MIRAGKTLKNTLKIQELIFKKLLKKETIKLLKKNQ